ncbi:MAG: YkoF family thiamine/hydroxymethylpyrimidine-binding protein [Bacillota bacterium]|nr:YkoF family thiamine/hydroxymethylpyrimidine-binding protein [Bacillota bacterium]
MICAEVSVYPQNTQNGNRIITDAIGKLNQQNVQCKVGSVSTHVDGNDDQVWQCVKSAWDTAKNAGEVNMVVTFSNISTGFNPS